MKPLSCLSTAFLFSLWAVSTSSEAPHEAVDDACLNVGITHHRRAAPEGGFRRPPEGRSPRRRSADARLFARKRRGKERAVYEKNSRRPCRREHGQGEFSTEGKQEKNRKKQNFFGKFFVLDNYVIFLEKWKAAGEKWIRKWISNRGRKPVKAVGIRLRYLPVTIRN